MRPHGSQVKLTSYSHGAGCACKLPLDDLGELLGMLGPQAVGEDVLVGLDEADDAAVIKLPGWSGATPSEQNDEALVLTLDFFTPIVDDAHTWGRIAAANAASDVYAMGGRPLVALNIVAWPRETIPLEVLADVLRGGREIATQGGFAIVGGHSIDDAEPKYGMVVVGRVDRSKLMTIDAAQRGDVLVLTKPIGTGVITTALKQDAAPDDALDAAVTSMTRLNAGAAAALTAHGVRACTDVTGFGLLGHLRRMLLASSVAASIDAANVPLIDGAHKLAEAGFVPGGTKRNLATVDPFVTWNGASEVTRALLSDAQTSGGLLASCPPDTLDALLSDLSGELACAVIGTVDRGEPGTIVVRGDLS